MKGVFVCPSGSCKHVLVPILMSPTNGRARLTRIRGFMGCPVHGIQKMRAPRSKKARAKRAAASKAASK